MSRQLSAHGCVRLLFVAACSDAEQIGDRAAGGDSQVAGRVNSGGSQNETGHKFEVRIGFDLCHEALDVLLAYTPLV